MPKEIVLTLTARWEGEWPDEIVTGYSFQGKTMRPDSLSLEVKRGKDYRGVDFASVKAVASGGVLKKNGKPGWQRTEITWNTGRYASDRRWADRPAWLAELADELVAEMLGVEAFGLPKVELEGNS